MKTLPQILICDDDPAYQQAVKYSLKGTCERKSAHNGDEALILLRKQKFDIDESMSKEDIPALLGHFVEKRASGSGRQFTAEAIEVLKSYPWPGNVRELDNVVAFLLAMTNSAEIDVADIPPQNSPGLRLRRRARARRAPSTNAWRSLKRKSLGASLPGWEEMSAGWL